MKVYNIILAFLLLSCSSAQVKSLEKNDAYKMLNDIYDDGQIVFIHPKSAEPYSKEFILNELQDIYPSFYNKSINQEFARKKDSILKILTLSETEKENAIKVVEEKVFFSTKDFFSKKELKDFSESISNKTVKWKSKNLRENIKLTKLNNSCAISLPIYNKTKTKALVFRKCDSSENFEALKLTENGNWVFVFSGNIIIYD